MDAFMGVVVIGSVVIVIIVYISFAIVVFRDATYAPLENQFSWSQL